MKKTAVVICPGRGTYNKTELGYLARHHSEKTTQIAAFDKHRVAQGQIAISKLDAADKFSMDLHTKGDNASALIYSSSILDISAISNKFEIVAVTGNSMGWYTALAAAGAVSPTIGFEIVNTMGALMQESLIGGQALYPFVDNTWAVNEHRKAELIELIAHIDALPDHILTVSIHLGGMLVLAGNKAGLSKFETSVPKVDGRFPMRLVNHAGFHSALQQPISTQAQTVLTDDLFQNPRVPLIDGRGEIWRPYATDMSQLHGYTFGHQIVEPYNFTRAIMVAAYSFTPEVFIIAGPGTTLGGAVAQSLISANWLGMSNKDDFQDQQSSHPVLISMGREDQRYLAIDP